jgi:hypothetical protein
MILDECKIAKSLIDCHKGRNTQLSSSGPLTGIPEGIPR